MDPTGWPHLYGGYWGRASFGNGANAFGDWGNFRDFNNGMLSCFSCFQLGPLHIQVSWRTTRGCNLVVDRLYRVTITTTDIEDSQQILAGQHQYIAGQSKLLLFKAMLDAGEKGGQETWSFISSAER